MAASSPDFAGDAVAKFVPKVPEAQRELLFVDLGEARNVVPIVDSGEHGDEYVLVMPRAEKALRDHIEGGGLTEAEAVAALSDIAGALDDLDGRVVHRDLKPENVLLLNGRWCLADFGISRYAEATTAPDTRKYAMTAPYAAPEQWQFERATAATDIYALGVIGYEMLAGARPIAGPSPEQYREQHLQQTPPQLQNVSSPLAALVAECLYKRPEARPSAGEVVQRLQRAEDPPRGPNLGRLQQAHEEEITARASQQSQAAAAQSAQERREALVADARTSFAGIADRLHDPLVGAAPSIERVEGSGDRWALRLGEATLRLTEPIQHRDQGVSLPFEVIAHASLSVEGRGYQGYRGRSHSLWYCDAGEAGRFAWQEVAFMETLGGIGNVAPFALSPADAAIAFSPTMGTKQLARSLRRLTEGELDACVERWGNWFADAHNGTLRMPMQLPEEAIEKSWRQAR